MPTPNYWPDFRSALRNAMVAAVPELSGKVYSANLARRNLIASMAPPFGVVRISRSLSTYETANSSDTTFRAWPELSIVYPGAEDEAPLHDALSRLRRWFDNPANVVTGAQPYTRRVGRWVRFDDDEPLNERAEAEGAQVLAATLAVEFDVDEGA